MANFSEDNKALTFPASKARYKSLIPNPRLVISSYMIWPKEVRVVTLEVIG
jgi:hypothetical protein